MFGCSVSAAQGTNDLSDSSWVKAFIHCDSSKKKMWAYEKNTERLGDLWICFGLQTSEKLEVLCEVDIILIMPNQLAAT